jgi:hypothetical protein
MIQPEGFMTPRFQEGYKRGLGGLIVPVPLKVDAV